MTLVPSLASAQDTESIESSPPPATTRSYAARTPEHVASLHRVAATLDTVLDIYRLALVEIVPAAALVEQAGLEEGATPNSLIPEPAREVFGRLATSVGSRVPGASLPAVPRGYHAEVMEALEQLALAEKVSDTREPLAALAHAVNRFTRGAGDVVDLFSRDRPVVARIIDPNTILDEISQSLDELGAAEAEIEKMRGRNATLGEQLHGFLRLEISLGHTLDLIALAEEAGLQIGFQLKMGTVGFTQLISRVNAQVAELRLTVDAMSAPPTPLSGSMRAELIPVESDLLELELAWPAAADSSVAAIRIYELFDEKITTEALIDRLRCDGNDAAKAAARAKEEVHKLDKSRVLLQVVEPTQTTGTRHLEEAPPVAPRYAAVPVSAFGVEGKGPEEALTAVPAELAGPPWIAAKLSAVTPEDDDFYEHADEVILTWGLSPNDVRLAGGTLGFAAEHRLPIVHRYQLVRIRGDDVTEVSTVYAGTTSYVDRVPIDDLAAGVKYSIVALDARGGMARPPDECVGSGDIKADRHRDLELAALGASDVLHPTSVELARRAELADPGAVVAARAQLDARDAAERQAVLAAWWSARPKAQRVQWLKTWPDHMNDEEQAAFFAEVPDVFAARDVPLVQAEVWLASQPPEVQGEVARWWSLLDREAQGAALEAWYSGLDGRVKAWIDERTAAGGDGAAGLRYEAEKPARVLAWFRSRDVSERAQLDRWWTGLRDQERERAVVDWYGTLDGPAQRSLRWPDWLNLTDAEQKALLAEGYRALPSGLYRDALGWLAWHELQGEALETAIVAEVGPVGSFMSRLRFATRPVDRVLAFRLPVLLMLLLIAGLMGFFLYRSLVRKKEMFLRRIPGIDAIEEAIGRATEMGRPVLFVPGIGEIQEIQTIAGLLILGKVSETISRYDSDIIVANIYPFVQTVAREVVQRGAYDAGRPDLYDPEDVRYVAAEQFPFTAGVNGIMMREKPAANLFLGQFFAESLILSETGFLAGAVQIAGTAEVFQLPFFIAACDYTLIGEELFAASAYLSGEPKLTSTLKAGDWVKVALVSAIVLGATLESFGVTAFTKFFVGH